MIKKIKEALSYIGDYKFNSILVKNLLVMIIFINIPIIIVIAILYLNMNNTFEDEILVSSQTSVERIGDTIDEEFEEIKRLAVYIGQMEKVGSFLVSKDVDDPIVVSAIKDMFEMYSYVYDYVDSIYIVSKVNGKIISDDTKIEMSIVKEFANIENHDMIVVPRIKRTVYPYLISFARPVYTKLQKEWNGMVIVNINITDLGNRLEFKKDNITEDVMVVNNDGVIMFSNHNDRFMKHVGEIPQLADYETLKAGMNEIVMIDGGAYVLSTAISDTGEWIYIVIDSVEYYQKQRKSITRYITLVFLLSILGSFIIALILTLRSFSPVLSIIKLLEEPNKFYKSYNKNQQKTDNEIAFIAEKILQIILSNDELRDNLESRIERLNHAQMTALQAQINPHFLYNTLETIRWLTVELTQGENNASRMIESLSELLRLSLESKEQVISIQEELTHAQFYLDIMRVRYEEKLQVIIDVDEGIKEYKTVKLILQPLIENAIYHGIKPKMGKSYIKIRGWMTEENIYLSVEDNGVGIEEEAMALTNKKLKSETKITSDHIGIVNVNQRIRIIYGDEYGVTIFEGDSGGVVAQIKMPK